MKDQGSRNATPYNPGPRQFLTLLELTSQHSFRLSHDINPCENWAQPFRKVVVVHQTDRLAMMMGSVPDYVLSLRSWFVTCSWVSVVFIIWTIFNCAAVKLPKETSIFS